MIKSSPRPGWPHPFSEDFVGMITFPGYAGQRSRMARTGCDEDDLAPAAGKRPLRRQCHGRRDPRHAPRWLLLHFLDMVAETAGHPTLDLIAQSLQMFLPGPHVGCPSCSCGLTDVERAEVRTRFLSSTSTAARRWPRPARPTGRRSPSTVRRASRCHDRGAAAELSPMSA